MKSLFMIFLLVLVTVVSCTELGNEPENYNTKKIGVYSINDVDGKGNFYVQYADLDSLDKFRDIGFSFYSGFWLASPEQYLNPLYNVYVIATLNKIYFFNTRSDKLIKQINLPYISHGFEDNFGVGLIKFLPYDNQRCILVRSYGVYMINLENKEIESVIFEGRGNSNDIIIHSLALTTDKRYLYLRTVTPTQLGAPQKLYKVDIILGTGKIIYQLSPNSLREDTTQSFTVGVSKDFVICTDGNNFFKFSTKSNVLLDKRKLNLKGLFWFNPFGDANSLVCFSSDSAAFYIFNAETLSLTKYFEINSSKMRGNYQEFADGLYFLVPSNPQGKNFIVNLTTKEIKYSFNSPRISSFIIKEVIDYTIN